MPRTKLGTRSKRSRASADQDILVPAPCSLLPSSNASSRPVVTIFRTVSRGWAGTVRPPISTTIEGRAHRAPHRVARFRSRDCDRQYLRRIAEDVAQLEVALHTGRKVEQKDVERAPSDVAKKLTKRCRLHRPSPHEALCSWPL